MFVVWDDGGNRIPYSPGSFRRRRVEKVSNLSSVQKTSSHTLDSEREDLRDHSTQRPTQIYESPDQQVSARTPAISAAQIMRAPVVMLPQTAVLSDAWGILQHHRFRHIPVRSAQGELVGILSDRDVFRSTIEIVTLQGSSEANLGHLPIQEIMVKRVLSAFPETEIRVIARTLFEERIGAMPIVSEDGKLVGILTRSDILRTVVKQAPFDLWV